MVKLNRKVAIVHDWLVVYAGAERVLEQLIKCFPEADLFAVVDFLPDRERKFLGGKPVTTTLVQKLPLARKRYRSYLPIMPLAIEQLDMSSYDIVISSSHAVAKGVLTGPDQLHICVCYSPIRYAWDLQHEYLRESGLARGLKGWVARWMLHKIRIWDVRTANGVDEYVAISRFIARRIKKFYRRPSEVIYPPVDVRYFEFQVEKGDFYLTASRMVPYKRIDLIVDAFSKMPDRKLVVIGDGPEFEKISASAGDNIQFLGYQPRTVLREYMQSAKAFVFAAQEDFGIAPLEAQSCGTPVIAYGKGGVLETVIDQNKLDSKGNKLGRTGVFFHNQSVGDVIKAISEFEVVSEEIDATSCRRNAERFSEREFRERITRLVDIAENRFLKSIQV